MHDDDTRPIMASKWWHDGLSATGLSWLQDTSYSQIDHDLLFAFVERWHEETSSFHLSFGEMTVTLDDMSCLLHLPIDGMLLSHETISRNDMVDMMMRYLGSSAGDALGGVTETRGAHARFNYLKKILKERLQLQLVLDNKCGMEEDVQRLRDQALCIYLLYLVGITLFTDKSANYVDVVYMRYFRDLDIVFDFSWGVACLSYLYRELNHVAHWSCSQLSEYLSLLHV